MEQVWFVSQINCWEYEALVIFEWKLDAFFPTRQLDVPLGENLTNIMEDSAFL